MARKNIIDKIHVLVSLNSQPHIPPPAPRTQTPAMRAIVVLSLGTLSNDVDDGSENIT